MRDLRSAKGNELNRTAAEVLRLNAQNILRHPDHMEKAFERLSKSWRNGTSSAFAEVLNFFNLPLHEAKSLEGTVVNLPGGNTLHLYSANYLILIQQFEPGSSKMSCTIIFATDWIERLTRCLSGSLLSVWRQTQSIAFLRDMEVLWMVKIATKTVSTTGTVGTNTWEWKSTV